jgi:hypothetical protein
MPILSVLLGGESKGAKRSTWPSIRRPLVGSVIKSPRPGANVRSTGEVVCSAW